MFKKIKLRRAIAKCKRCIEYLEKKRSRSQAALVESILTNKEPADEDVEFFNLYTSRINAERDKMHQFEVELGSNK